MAAFKLPRGSVQETQQREEAIQTATIDASEVPFEVAEQSVALYERLGQLEAIVAASMKSDLHVGRLMAAAGAKGAMANVEINLDGITDKAYVHAMRQKLDALRGKLDGSARATGGQH
jgi:formiminotetrahydrofolate cyclodeaminase